MATDAVVLAELIRRVSPLGSMEYWAEAGPTINQPDGSEWLRSGTVKAAAGYTVAASLEHIKVSGVPVTLPAAVLVTQIATDSAGTFVAAYGSSSNLLVSTNGGATWATVSHGLGSGCYGVAYGGGVFVTACGTGATASFASATPAAVTSTWTSRGTLSSALVNCRIFYGGGKFVAIPAGSGTAAANSSTGTSWSNCTLTASSNGPALWTGTKWLVSPNGASTSGSQSTDGATWSAWTAPVGNIASMAYGNSVALIQSNVGVYRSTDGGTTWALVNVAANSGYAPLDLNFDGTRFMATAGDASTRGAWYSTDGLTWAVRNLALADGTRPIICSDGTRLVAMPAISSAAAVYSSNFSTADYVGITQKLLMYGGNPDTSAIGYVRIK